MKKEQTVKINFNLSYDTIFYIVFFGFLIYLAYPSLVGGNIFYLMIIGFCLIGAGINTWTQEKLLKLNTNEYLANFLVCYVRDYKVHNSYDKVKFFLKFGRKGLFASTFFTYFFATLLVILLIGAILGFLLMVFYEPGLFGKIDNITGQISGDDISSQLAEAKSQMSAFLSEIIKEENQIKNFPIETRMNLAILLTLLGAKLASTFSFNRALSRLNEAAIHFDKYDWTGGNNESVEEEETEMEKDRI